MSLLQRALFGLGGVILAMAVLLFAGAGTLRYWQAWVFLTAYLAASIAITLYLAEHDPALLERRMRGGPFAEKQSSQKIIMSIASVGFIGLMLVPAIDHRFGWSQMSAPVALAGNFLMLLGWFGIFLVFRENSFTASTIELAADQRVISTGPYRWVRHPMYSAALLMLFGIPIALGSWWGVLIVVAIIPIIVWRLLDEERFLANNLAGYREYQGSTRFRLLPGLW